MDEVDGVVCRLPTSTGEETFTAERKKKRKGNSFRIRTEGGKYAGSVKRRSQSHRFCLDDPERARISLFDWVIEEKEGRKEGRKEKWWSEKYEAWKEYRPTKKLRLVAKGILETYFFERSDGKSHGRLDNLKNYILHFHAPTFGEEEEREKVSVYFINSAAEQLTGTADFFAKDLEDIYKVLFVDLMPDPKLQADAQIDLDRENEVQKKKTEGQKMKDIVVIEEIGGEIRVSHDLLELKYWLLTLRNQYEADPDSHLKHSLYIQKLRKCAVHPVLWHPERRMHLYGKIRDAYKQLKPDNRTQLTSSMDSEMEDSIINYWSGDNMLPAGHPFRNVYEDNDYRDTDFAFIFFSRDVVHHIHKKVRAPPGTTKKRDSENMVMQYFDENTQGEYNDKKFVELELRRLYPGLLSELYFFLCFGTLSWFRR